MKNAKSNYLRNFRLTFNCLCYTTTCITFGIDDCILYVYLSCSNTVTLKINLSS